MKILSTPHQIWNIFSNYARFRQKFGEGSRLLFFCNGAPERTAAGQAYSSNIHLFDQKLAIEQFIVPGFESDSALRQFRIKRGAQNRFPIH